MALEQDLATLIIEQVDFIDDQLETATEETLVAYGEAHALALQIKNAAGTDDAKTLEVASGVLKLANAFGKSFKQLDEAQANTVSDAIKQIVSGTNEELIEGFYDKAFNVITKVKNLNETVDNLTAPDEEGENEE